MGKMAQPLTSDRVSWEELIEQGVRKYLYAHGTNMRSDHLIKTPARVVSAMKSQTRGLLRKPESFLDVTFSTDGGYNEMVHVSNIKITSTCGHHLLPFIGRAHFAYIPNGSVVGLSKIPRFIRALSLRLQVQEDLSQQIVDTFMNVVHPKGCAVYMAAMHSCMAIRGVKEHDAVTITTACRGVFMSEPFTRQEFLSAAEKRITL